MSIYFEIYFQRFMVITTKDGDKLHFRGHIKCHIVSGYKIAAQNIKRFVRFMQGGYPTKMASTV
jgi:hypothetical protein